MDGHRANLCLGFAAVKTRQFDTALNCWHGSFPLCAGKAVGGNYRPFFRKNEHCRARNVQYAKSVAGVVPACRMRARDVRGQ